MLAKLHAQRVQVIHAAILEPIFEANLDREVITLGIRDYQDSVDNLAKTVRYFRGRGAHFTTMTQAASEHFEHHRALAAV